MAATTSNETGQYVTLGIAEEIFAVPVSRVHEILELKPIAPLPQAPDTLLGLIDVRGVGIPVIDLRRTLGLPAVEDTPTTRILVLWLRQDGADLMIGLKTDRVFEVTVLDEMGLEPPPGLGILGSRHAIEGIGRRNCVFVTVFDLDRLLGGADLSAVPDADRSAHRAA